MANIGTESKPELKELIGVIAKAAKALGDAGLDDNTQLHVTAVCLLALHSAYHLGCPEDQIAMMIRASYSTELCAHHLPRDPHADDIKALLNRVFSLLDAEIIKEDNSHG